jgi:AAA domain
MVADASVPGHARPGRSALAAVPAARGGDRASWQRVVIDGLEAHGYVTRHRSDGHAEFRCPVHEDTKPSGTADYDPAEGKTLICCHRQCATVDVLAAVGCTLADLYDRPPERPDQPMRAAPRPCRHRLRLESRHPYPGADGQVVNTVIRKRCALCRVKDVRPERPWPEDQRILYRLPEVLEAIRRGDTIWVHEGEACADALAELGHASTTNPFGAGKWRDTYTETLRGARRVVIVADNDAAGYRHAADVAAQLAAAGIPEVDVVRAAVNVPKADIADHLEHSGTPETLIPVDPAVMLAQLEGSGPASSAARPPLELAATVRVPDGQRIPVDPLQLPASISLLDARRYDPGDWPHVVPGLLPVGLILIYGRPGVAKTTMSAQLEHCIAAGTPVAGYQPDQAGRCLVVDFEGGPMLAIGQSLRIAPFGTLATDIAGDPDEMISVRTQWPGDSFTERCGELEKCLRDSSHEGRPYLLVRIDTMRAFMGPPPLGMNAYQWDADCLIKLNALARELHTAIVVIHHPNKSGEVSGSVGVEGSCTAAYRLERRPGESEGLLRCTKNRVGPEISYAVEFDTRAGTWEFTETITAAQAANTGVKRAIIDYLTAHGPASGPDIRAALPGARDRTIRDMLTRLRHDGWIDRNPDGVWMLAAAPGPDLAPQPTEAAAAAASSEIEAGSCSGSTAEDRPAGQPEPRKRYPIGTCTACGTPMTIIMTGQTLHPLCEPDPAPATAPEPAAPEPADGQAPDTCNVCGELRTNADTHPDCDPREVSEAKWPGMTVMREAFRTSRMKPVPWIPPAGHPSAKPGMQTRDLPQWQAADQVDIGAFRWTWPGLEEIDPESLVATIDRNSSYPSACSSVPLAPNVLRPVTLEGDPKAQGLAGIAEVIVSEWSRADLPHPLGRNAVPGQPLVIPSGSLEELWALHRLGLISEPQVTCAYMGRRNTSLFEPFYKAVKTARAEHAANEAMTLAIKRSSSITVRLLYPKSARSPWWRPDWYGALVGQAMIRHWIRAQQAVDAGATLVYLGSVDEAAYLLPDGADPDTWVPAPYERGTGPGQVKPKAITVRTGHVDLAGIDPARIRPAPSGGTAVEITGPVPLRIWQARRG